MSSTCLGLFESQDKEYSFRQFLTEGSDSNDERRSRMKKLLYIAIENELTQRQRDCIRMKIIEGMTAEEVAAQLHLSTDTVYKHIRAGLKNLRKVTCYL